MPRITGNLINAYYVCKRKLWLIKDIEAIINRDKPPSVEKVKYCRNCTYNDFCWS